MFSQSLSLTIPPSICLSIQLNSLISIVGATFLQINIAKSKDGNNLHYLKLKK